MRDRVRQWLVFAEENLACARLVANNGYYNPALQNAQQAVEKALKAVLAWSGLELRKTHRIQELNNILAAGGQDVGLSDEDCELLDSIYLPSKYPIGNALPDADPDRETCDQCVAIAVKVLCRAGQIIGGEGLPGHALDDK